MEDVNGGLKDVKSGMETVNGGPELGAWTEPNGCLPGELSPARFAPV